MYYLTGVSGFIASNIASYIQGCKDEIVGLDNFSTGFKSNLALLGNDNFKFMEGDIRSLETCRKACEGADYVIHQAALGSVPRSLEQPLLYNENNITGTLNMLIAAKEAGVKSFVFASSSSVYGDTEVLPKVETMIPNPKSPYALGKITGEYYCRIFTEEYGLPTVILRYFNVFGPRQDPKSQYSAVIPKFITSFLKNESPVIYGDGEQTRDFTYVENVVKANLLACDAPKEVWGKPINIGCGSRVSINMLAKIIKDLTKSSAEIRYEDPRPGDVKDSLADITIAKEKLGLTDYISLEQGLEKTVAWYKEQLGL
jgi:UDP-N-acetylglucosamine/UDP-N-acetylgalactosamine 4-epimerase